MCVVHHQVFRGLNFAAIIPHLVCLPNTSFSSIFCDLKISFVFFVASSRRVQDELTALFMATIKGHTDCATLLINAGANVEIIGRVRGA